MLHFDAKCEHKVLDADVTAAIDSRIDSVDSLKEVVAAALEHLTPYSACVTELCGRMSTQLALRMIVFLISAGASSCGCMPPRHRHL